MFVLTVRTVNFKENYNLPNLPNLQIAKKHVFTPLFRNLIKFRIF